MKFGVHKTADFAELRVSQIKKRTHTYMCCVYCSVWSPVQLGGTCHIDDEYIAYCVSLNKSSYLTKKVCPIRSPFQHITQLRSH